MALDLGSLAGKTAVVTGGGKGIGRAISVALASMEAKVYIVYRGDAGAAEQVAQEIGGEALQCDVSDSAAVAAAFKGIG